MIAADTYDKGIEIIRLGSHGVIGSMVSHQISSISYRLRPTDYIHEV